MTIVRHGNIPSGDNVVISVASNAGASFSVPNIYEPNLRRTLPRSHYSEVEVVNLDGGPIYFRTDGEEAAEAEDDNHIVPGADIDTGGVQSLVVPIDSADVEISMYAPNDTIYAVEIR